MNFTIITDTAANLPQEYVSEKKIDVVPFSYFVDGVEHSAGENSGYNASEFYGMLRSGISVSTSQIHPHKYIEHIEPHLAAGEDVLFVGLSSGVSGSFNSARLAAEHLKKKYPERELRLVDSLGASLGEGLLVIRAVECRERGAGIDETANILRTVRQRIAQIFTVDDLMHLRRGGRLSGFSAVVGTALGIKPLLKGDERGRIVNSETVRGRRRAIAAIAAKYDELVRDADKQTVGISHADCPEDAELLRTMIMANNPPKEIITVGHEPMTGSHVGPGMLALYFEGDTDVRSK